MSGILIALQIMPFTIWFLCNMDKLEEALDKYLKEK